MSEINKAELDDDELGEISLFELTATDLNLLPDKTGFQIFESNFPECFIEKDGDKIFATLTEHIYSKYWWYKYHARVFADAMIRAILRLIIEGHPFSNPELESDDDVHIFVRWTLSVPAKDGSQKLIESIEVAYNLVWQRANSILENSDSVLVLGKDTGAGLDRLREIVDELEKLGYYTYIIKEQPDRLGESIIQKVLRYALSSKFVIIENSEASGHLYEVPHVAKLAECITVILQEEGKGATWMFEDAYARYAHWHKLNYKADEIPKVVVNAAEWAETFHRDFADYQQAHLPWLNK